MWGEYVSGQQYMEISVIKTELILQVISIHKNYNPTGT